LSEISSKQQIKYLQEIIWSNHIDFIIETVYLYTRPKKGLNKLSIFFVEVISALGHGLRNTLKKPKDSALAARTGAFILYTFEELGMLQVVKGSSSNGHNQYIVQVTNDEAICNLWTNIKVSNSGKLPATIPYSDWVTTRSSDNEQLLVKTQNREVLQKLNAKEHPIVFDCVNKAQRVGWVINKEILAVSKWALKNKTDAFAEIWELASREAKTTKLREANSIHSIAEKFVGVTFYHQYYLDFRGRKYPTTAYLHEQGSDLARGLLSRAIGKPLGSSGYKWLLIWLASTWGGDAGRPDKRKTDKIPLRDREEWSEKNKDLFIQYATNPKENQGWMSADKPWQFLAACIELKRIKDWLLIPSLSSSNNIEDYVSRLECYIDGSNNGSQHLSALTLDDVTAVHVNLTKSEYPGDLYEYVAEHVWKKINSIVDEFSGELRTACNDYIDALTTLKKAITDSEPKSDARAALVQRLKDYKEDNRDVAENAAVYFWYRITDKKSRRKIVKR